MIIAIDFDGTCVTNDFPEIGKDIGAVPVLKELAEKGHRLILLTNRADSTLSDAVGWFRRNGIPLYGINHNPQQYRFSKSPKIYANLYIDDTALGCPLKNSSKISPKPFVDWKKVHTLLVNKDIL